MFFFLVISELLATGLSSLHPQAMERRFFKVFQASWEYLQGSASPDKVVIKPLSRKLTALYHHKSCGIRWLIG